MSRWSRRQVLATLGYGAAVPWAARLCARPGVPAAVPPPSPADPSAFPLAAAVAGFRDAAARAAAVAPTGLRRGDYLRLIDGIVRFFAPMQDPRGAIIDPYEKTERQYSTPAFALAAAALCTARSDAALLEAAVKALRSSCADLADGKAADGHADFFTVLAVHADRLLRPLAGEAAAASWRRDLGRVEPARIYRRQPTDAATNNWNLVAAAGEWLRTADGFGASLPWIDASLSRQLEHFTDCGMYRDPNDPLAYDHFARLWVLDLLEEGYAGPHAARLRAHLDRGAWASLLMQSPCGELPCGGRSAHHQWNEAEQAVTFECDARRFAALGDRLAAGACKRAARLALQSVARWVRPSGELWIVKNRVDPSRRHGYESYSFHSQYNLLAAAMLALAWLRADDGIDEGPCPAETGGFAFALQPAFHKVMANAGGTFIEIDTGADAHYNPTGLLRLHHRGLDSGLLSDGACTGADYTLPSKPSRSLALGPAWRDRAGAWHALAEHAAGDIDTAEFTPVPASPDRVEFAITYRGRLRGGATSIRETCVLAAGNLTLSHRVEGDVTAVRQVWPFLQNDGATPSTITAVPHGVEVLRRGAGVRFEALTSGATVGRFDAAEPCRNGFMGAGFAECQGPAIAGRVTVRPVPGPEPEPGRRPTL